jgi:hypothetical protein
MAALMFVESFHIEKLYGRTQTEDSPHFSVRQMQHGHYLLSPALFCISVQRVPSKKLISNNFNL